MMKGSVMTNEPLDADALAALIEGQTRTTGSSSVPGWVRTWLIVLSVVVGLQLLLTIGGLIVASLSVTAPFLMYGPGGFDDTYMQADGVAQEITYLLQDDDVEGYMDLYPEDDPTVDREQVREDFERAVASLETSASIDYTADQVVRYEDGATGEEILRVDMSCYDWNTGEMIGRGLTVWVLADDLPETVLTGVDGRELGDAEYAW